MIKLYQFPISHYCEKVRWALDYKQLKHEVINMVPGLHVNQTKKMGLRTSVPILQHDDKFIQGSIEIIDYLDEEFSFNQLTPGNENLKSKAIEWELYLDKEVGIHVRRCVYNILLEHPEIVKPFFAHNGPWYGRLFLAYNFPKLRSRMRKFMDINDESSVKSEKKLNLSIEKLDNHYQTNNFLVGDQFTRADLSAAALFAPLTMQKEYGLNWPENIPQKLQELMDEFSDKIKWVDKVYKGYREIY